MKHVRFLALIVLSLFSMSSSCSKQEDAQPAPLTLPLTAAFTDANVALSADKTSFVCNGLDFTGALTTSSSFPSGVLPCLAATNTPIKVGSGRVTLLGQPGINCLIADVSKLPAMKKISVEMSFDNGRPGTQITLCDGNQVIGNSKTYINGSGTAPTYLLDVNGKTASKLYVYCSEGSVASITFE